MLTYQHKSMEEDTCDKINDGDVKPKSKWSLDHKEKIRKLYLSQCDANNINGVFIECVTRESIGIKLKTEED